MRKTPIAGIGLVILCSAISCTKGGVPVQTTQFTPEGLTNAQMQARFQYGWGNLPWTGDDRPYAKIRAAIDQRLAEGQLPQELWAEYGVAAQRSPSDPEAQFAWAYAAWKASRVVGGKGDSLLFGVPEALAAVPFQPTYQYARTRYLVEGGTVNLQALGERLLAHDRTDCDVMYELVLNYAGVISMVHEYKTVSSAYRVRALTLSNRLIQTPGYEPLGWKSLAYTYTCLWQRDHLPADKAAALKAFQRYDAVADPKDVFREDEKIIMHRLDIN